MSELIQTLDTNEGKNPGEAIASYGRSIVFLPPGTLVGKRVRVKLEEITTKKDSRGRIMYKGIPADVEYTERWKDNGDGTASCVAIATNWLLEESEEGVLETRALAGAQDTDATNHRTTSTYRVAWGSDLRSSTVIEEREKIIPLVKEVVRGGVLMTEVCGERKENLPSTSFLVTSLEVTHEDQVAQGSLKSVQGKVWYEKPGGTQYSTVLNTTWVEMPDWWRKQIEARYPMCSCGRQRYDSEAADGYKKCTLCRDEEVCERCGKRARVELNQSGRNVCETCKPWETKEKFISHILNADHLAAIVAEAQRLRQGQAFPREEGLMLLKSTLDHGLGESAYTALRLHEKWDSTTILNNRVEWQWYYFCKDGTYGSVYSPAALELLSFLTQATGDALVELVSWIAEPQFYLATQVRGETVGMPSLVEPLKLFVAKRLGRGEPVLSERLRGPEIDRIEAVAGYKRLVEILGEGSGEARAVAAILWHENQDYVAAVKKIREIEGKRASVQSSAVEAVQSGRLNLAALRENWGAKVKLR